MDWTPSRNNTQGAAANDQQVEDLVYVIEELSSQKKKEKSSPWSANMYK